jgi:hypothetical protein
VEVELALAEGLPQVDQECVAEPRAENFYREEERTPASDPTRAVWSDTATGHHTVNVRVEAPAPTILLSTGSPDVQVFYPFHPLHGATLQILRRPKGGDAAVCVIDPTGRRLKIPAWMLSRDSAEIQIAERPQLSKGVLLSLAPLIASQLDSKDHVHDNLLQTAVDGCKGGRRGAITISGPDDPKERLGRATGRSDTRRSDRSHGPRSGGGLSRGGRKS